MHRPSLRGPRVPVATTRRRREARDRALPSRHVARAAIAGRLRRTGPGQPAHAAPRCVGRNHGDAAGAAGHGPADAQPCLGAARGAAAGRGAANGSDLAARAGPGRIARGAAAACHVGGTAAAIAGLARHRRRRPLLRRRWPQPRRCPGLRRAGRGRCRWSPPGSRWRRATSRPCRHPSCWRRPRRRRRGPERLPVKDTRQPARSAIMAEEFHRIRRLPPMSSPRSTRPRPRRAPAPRTLWTSAWAIPTARRRPTSSPS
jgi:hypothetical protein